MSDLSIGTGRSDITPAPGSPQGIWGAQTHERGVGADLPLYATALAVSDSRQSALIIDVDAIGFNAEWSGKILDAVTAMTGVPRDHIRVASTHTHSGPKTVRLDVVTEGLDMAVQYLEMLPLRIAGAAWQALNNLKPARVAAGSGACAINVNRRLKLPDGRLVVGRNWDGPVDHTVRVVRFDDLDEKPARHHRALCVPPHHHGLGQPVVHARLSRHGAPGGGTANRRRVSVFAGSDRIDRTHPRIHRRPQRLPPPGQDPRAGGREGSADTRDRAQAGAFRRRDGIRRRHRALRGRARGAARSGAANHE